MQVIWKVPAQIPAGQTTEGLQMRSCKSGREDLNLRPPGPEPGALTGLRYAPKDWTLSRRSGRAPSGHQELGIGTFVSSPDTYRLVPTWRLGGSASSIIHAPRRSRTPSLLIRSQTLYPVELWAPYRLAGIEAIDVELREDAEPPSR